MKKIILVLLVSCIIGAVAYHVGYNNALANDDVEYKFFDTALDENGQEIQLYVKVTHNSRVSFTATAQ